MNTNLIAFLGMVGVSEGTVTCPITKNCGYDVIVKGADGKWEIFSDYQYHPFEGGRAPKIIRIGLSSDAAGRYQIMLRFWSFYKVMLKLPDFSPDSQDKVAVQLIKECHALDDILLGHFDIAVKKCKSRWASLPGAGYGQHENSLTSLRLAYTEAGGSFA